MAGGLATQFLSVAMIGSGMSPVISGALAGLFVGAGLVAYGTGLVKYRKHPEMTLRGCRDVFMARAKPVVAIGGIVVGAIVGFGNNFLQGVEREWIEATEALPSIDQRTVIDNANGMTVRQICQDHSGKTIRVFIDKQAYKAVCN